MDATLDTLRGIEKNLRAVLPKPPSWELVTNDVDAQICFQYPTFTGSPQPQIQIKVDALHDKNLLARLTSDPKHGFSPPFKFTLIRAGDAFHEKKQTETRFAWSKGDWVWSPKFSCRQLDAKTKTLKNVSMRIDMPLGKKTKKVSEFIVLFRERESLNEFRSHLRVQFEKLLQEKADSYATFLRYCGLAQLHHIDKQRKKIEAQMVDVYETWTKSFPDKVLA